MLVVTPMKGLLVDGMTGLNVRCLYNIGDVTLTLPAGPNGAGILIRYYFLLCRSRVLRPLPPSPAFYGRLARTRVRTRKRVVGDRSRCLTLSLKTRCKLLHDRGR